MTHARTTAPSSATADIAREIIRAQGQWGRLKQLACEHNVQPREIFRIRERADAALEHEFAEKPSKEESAEDNTESLPDDKLLFYLPVTVGHLKRAVVALRVVAPCSIRDIVALLPILFGSVAAWSYGKIQSLLVEAGQRAAAFLNQVDLSKVDSCVLDEMFSQGQPVLAGLDPVSQILFLLQVRSSRTGEEWANALGGPRDAQGLNPDVVIKDAGTGLAKGVKECWPETEQRDDLFHAVHVMLIALIRLERRAYAAINKEYELEKRKGKGKTETERRGNGQKLRKARENSSKAIERFDTYEQLCIEARQYLKLARPGTGELYAPEEVVMNLERIGMAMMALGGKYARKAGRYLKNRAKGLAVYLDSLANNIDKVTDEAGGEAMVEAVIRFYQATLNVESKSRNEPERKAKAQELRLAIRHLVECAGGEKSMVCQALGVIGPILDQRQRASSAIENLNSVLRPYLVVHKNVTQGFLDLFRFFWNLRIREWGRGKGTSAYQQLTGIVVPDWLETLGYPRPRVGALLLAA